MTLLQLQWGVISMRLCVAWVDFAIVRMIQKYSAVVRNDVDERSDVPTPAMASRASLAC